MSWFQVHKDGLAAIAARDGYARPIRELIQNSLDTDADRIDVHLVRIDRSPYVKVVVEDNSTDGFVDIDEAWTLFSPSKKAGNAELRGRFNLGEKLILAMARNAEIHSVNAAVRFDEDGNRKRLKTRRDRGTLVAVELRITDNQLDTAVADLRKLITPTGVTVTVNGEIVDQPDWIGGVEVKLPTETANRQGVLTKTARKTKVDVYYPNDGQGWLYEMGLPICEIAAPFDVNVNQVVPMPLERTGVSAAYLNRIYAALLRVTADGLHADEYAELWVTDGMAKTSDEAIINIVEGRYGKNAVVSDPSNRESNKIALNAGATVIPASAFNVAQWERIRTIRQEDPAFAPPAGKAFPVGVKTSADGAPPIPADKWTADMVAFAEFVVSKAADLNVPVSSVEFTRVDNRFTAWHGNETVTFNLKNLPNGFITAPYGKRAHALIIHEFAHAAGVDDHLTDDFHRTCCDIAAAWILNEQKGNQ